MITVFCLTGTKAKNDLNEERVLELTGKSNVIDYPKSNIVISVGTSLYDRNIEVANLDRKRDREMAESYTGKGEAIKLYQDNTNNCVKWVKNKTGINRTLGTGARLAIQGKEPKIGAIGAEKGKVAHAVLIVGIDGDKIIINESNYVKNWITSRVLSRSDFLGFIYN